MFSFVIVCIVFGSIVALAALICGTILIIVKSRRDHGPRGGLDQEETKIVQEVYRSLERMEARIEALETILAESQEKEGSSK
jgi:phage shock protein B